MDKNDFIEQMKKLAACELSPEEWLEWWRRNESDSMPFLDISKGEYGRIKPGEHDFVWVPVLCSHEGAVRYLEDRQIPHEKCDAYRKNYEKELADYAKAVKKEENRKLAELKTVHPLLFERYPKFAGSLKFVYSLGDTLAAGATEEQIRKQEKFLGFSLPEDIAAFFRVMAELHTEGLEIRLNLLRMAEIDGKTYCVLGEFWKEADGDLLLFDPRDTSVPTRIYYYAHERNTVKLLKKGMAEVVEKTFVHYNRSQA